MTSPVAVIGLVWDGYDLQRSDLDILFEVAEGLDDLPDTRGSDQVIPFLAGRMPGIRTADRRAVVANGWITGRGDAAAIAYRTYLDDLKARLDPMARPRQLVVTLEDGSTRWINVVPRNLLPGKSLGSDYRAFSIEWEALDPFWYGSNGLIAMDTGLLMDADYLMDQDAKVIITPTSPSFDITVFTHGTVDSTDVVIEIDGPSATFVTVQNLTTDPPIGFAHDLLAVGQTLIVDSGRRTARIDATNSRANLTLDADNRHGEYFRLRPGDNHIKILGQPTQVRLSIPATFL